MTFSPQDTPHKPLNSKERVVYRKKTGKYLLIQVLFVYISSFYFECFDVLVIAWTIQTFMLLFGYLKNKNNCVKVNKL